MSQSQGVKEDQQAEGERGGRTRERMWLVWLERLGEESGVGLGQFCPSPGSLNCSVQFSSVQFSSVAQSCPTLCDPMIAARQASLSPTTQTHVHRVSDAIPPSYLSPPSPPTFNLSQHQGLFQ